MSTVRLSSSDQDRDFELSQLYHLSSLNSVFYKREKGNLARSSLLSDAPSPPSRTGKYLPPLEQTEMKILSERAHSDLRITTKNKHLVKCPLEHCSKSDSLFVWVLPLTLPSLQEQGWGSLRSCTFSYGPEIWHILAVIDM